MVIRKIMNKKIVLLLNLIIRAGMVGNLHFI